MKSAILVTLFLLPMAYALDIGLSIENLFSVDVLYFSYNDTGARSFTTELLNSGSLPYHAQVRVDIFDQNRTVFTGWSDRKKLMPGNNGFFRLYWIPEYDGNYRARLRIYYGNELEERWAEITATNMTSESVFDVTYARAFDKYLELSIDGPVKEIAIIPADYPQGWVFVQRAGMPGRFLMPYNAPGLDGRKITVYIASESGFTKKDVFLQREQGMDAILRNLALGALSTI